MITASPTAHPFFHGTPHRKKAAVSTRTVPGGTTLPRPSSTSVDPTAVQRILRHHRARLDPAALGLTQPLGSGRRAKGPSQEQMDDLLGWGRGTYQRLESGRNPNLSYERLAAAGRFLGLSEPEWAILCAVLHGKEPPRPLRQCAGTEAPGEWIYALEAITEAAYINDRAWNVLVHNAAAAAMFPRGVVPPNLLRWMLLDPEARCENGGVLINWATEWAPVIVPQLRATIAALPDDPTLAGIEADVRADPVAGPIYEQFKVVVVDADGAIRPIRHATHGVGWTTLSTSEPLTSPRTRLMIAVYHREKPTRLPPLRSLATPPCDAHTGQRSHAA